MRGNSGGRSGRTAAAGPGEPDTGAADGLVEPGAGTDAGLATGAGTAAGLGVSSAGPGGCLAGPDKPGEAGFSGVTRSPTA
ncbi:MAG: hypothetical protein LBK64_04410 [Spirochaetaceae bacterium]|nr:hypothetical protein [Spirochaetaceae bacterium]